MLALTLFICSLASYVDSNPVNIVWIVIDDLGWDDVDIHGSDQIPTPNIAKLAKEGVVLENFYTMPICTPSRGALMTGRYPIHLGLQHDVIKGAEPWGLPPQFKIMPQFLRGFGSHMVGKWHLGHHRSEYLPMRRGFSSYFGYHLGQTDYYNHWGSESAPAEGHLFNGLDLWYNGSPIKSLHGQYSTDLFTRRAINILEKHNKSAPLFLFLAHQGVHVGSPEEPLQAPRNFIEANSNIHDDVRRHYAAMVSTIDDSIGKVMKALRDNGYADNTILFISNDNGGPTRRIAGSGSSNHPLRGTKYTLWEGGVRGTGIMWSPKHLKAGNYKNLVHIVDILPTCLEAVGQQIPRDLDGISFWRKMTGHNGDSRNEFLYNIDPVWNSWAYRFGKYKLISSNSPIGYSDWSPTVESRNLTRTIKCHGAGGRFCSGKHTPCLFDIESDPCEEDDISTENPDIVEVIQRRIEEFKASMVPIQNKPATERANPALFDYIWMPWEDSLIPH